MKAYMHAIRESHLKGEIDKVDFRGLYSLSHCFLSSLPQLFSKKTTSQQIRNWLEDLKVITQAQMQRHCLFL